mgnify:CR=1 FL=1
MKNYDYKDEQKDVKGKVSRRQKRKIFYFEALILTFTSKFQAFRSF